jgi:lysozyme
MIDINTAGKDLIKFWEGKPGTHEPMLEAYYCPAGKLTIGWGHTGDVEPGDRITYHQAERIFEYDVDRHAGDVFALLHRTTCNENQFAALVSFCFNFGAAKLGGSTLLKMFRAGDVQGAADQFPRWKFAKNKQGKWVVLQGLIDRRFAEQKLFLSPVVVA